MEANKTVIIEKAGEIIMNSGIESLTIHNLANELVLNEKKLYQQLTNDDDILLMILLNLETELNEFVREFANNGESPETELKLLFKRLYFLFLQKPYYLSLIFDKNLRRRDESIKKAVLRIKCVAEDYLTSIINNGKKQNTFNTNEPTKFVVNKILSGFRLFMKDEQCLNEMILELKTLKTLID